VVHTSPVPKLWTSTIEGHRRAVREATLDATAALVAEHGLRPLTMSQIAEKAGIGRATLYKYFADVETILRAWHERQITQHLAQLAELQAQPGRPVERLAAVLEAYAVSAYGSGGHHGTDLAALLHRDGQVGSAQQQLLELLRGLLVEAAHSGDIRDDIAAAELAAYCLHALSAATGLSSRAAVRRLVALTLAGLRR
jgi:AcrR family transcriptional regulator